jgi:hypothetical protein
MNLDGFGSAFRPELRMMPSDSLAIENRKLAADRNDVRDFLRKSGGSI